ncbi:alpha/beta-hydrolase [Lentinula guzmanii]|uniref:triacylglycerol lipase n=1 Tax=Lentinula guzmanii TaxID=2804957 RepID=A0AA38JQR3_9AGAR|nr:alpha/beta-hydrolase [Lentinula guzmanii]
MGCQFEMLDRPLVPAQFLFVLLLILHKAFVSALANVQLKPGELSFTHQHELLPRYGHSLSKNTPRAPVQSTIDNRINRISSQPPTKSNLDVKLKTRPTAIYRPRSLDVFHEERRIALHREKGRIRNQEQTWTLETMIDEGDVHTMEHDSDRVNVNWDIIYLDGPDVQNLQTLAQLARMSGNAYALGPTQKNWYELDRAWNVSFPFGYEDAEDGFRGHVFLSSDNSTIVLAIKGTTLQGPTSKKDKFNDNLLFSCCCARVDFSWVFRQVCDCYSGSWKCDNTCLSNALVEESLLYTVGLNLVNDLLALYPSANLWLVGHSLGGALASLLGSTFGLPAVAFESPGERLAALRLGLPIPTPPPAQQLPPESDVIPERILIPSLSPTTHIYHTADPIPQGTCTGPFSPCSQTGYALETRCHLGQSIVFDTVTELGWRVDLRKHPIREVVGLMEMWDQEEEVTNFREARRRQVPEAKEEVDCVDCFKWEFGEFKDKELEHPVCGD